MIDFAYEDLETEAVKEREENEAYEAECAREDEQLELNAKAEHPKGWPTPRSAFEPTPTKAQNVKATAEFSLKCMTDDPASRYVDLEILRMITRLAEAIDER